jgi:hypothetical protein
MNDMGDLYANIGQATIVSRGFLPLAVEAGIEETIASLVGSTGIGLRELLLAIKAELGEGQDPPNRPLAEALNLDNLSAILGYVARSGGAVLPASQLVQTNLPTLLDEDGPASLDAARDGEVTGQINLSFPESPSGYTDYEVYLDGVYWKTGSEAAVDGWVNDSIADVPDGAHTARVLYLDEDGAQTRFGPVAEVGE